MLYRCDHVTISKLNDTALLFRHRILEDHQQQILGKG